jgi:thiamine pyrophosphokinase
MPAEGGDPLVDRPDIVVLAGGDPLPAALLDDVADAIDAATLVIAADSGIGHARRAGRDVHVVVGDLDSIDPEDLERARRSGAEILAHPADKDATDLDLALDVAHARWSDPRRPEVLVVGGHGGRTDHLIANVLTLASERHAPLSITAWLGTDVVHVVRDRAVIGGPSGSMVTLLAVHGPATGVTTSGLRFALADAVLPAGSSLGVSNVLDDDTATVTVSDGVLVAIRSDRRRDDRPADGTADRRGDGPAGRSADGHRGGT